MAFKHSLRSILQSWGHSSRTWRIAQGMRYAHVVKYDRPMVLGLLAFAGVATLGAGWMPGLLSIPSAQAQPRIEVRDSRTTGEYAGVTPDNDRTPPRHGAAQRDAERRLVTWPGFQMRPGGGSRFFLQVNQTAQTELVRNEDRVELLVRGTRTHVRNTRLPLETRFFNTPVTRARVEVRGDDVVFVMTMRADVMPTVTSRAGANGYQYVFIDFPAGRYVEGPAAPPTPAPARETRAAEDDTPSGSQDDDVDVPAPLPPGMRDAERPPGM